MQYLFYQAKSNSMKFLFPLLAISLFFASCKNPFQPAKGHYPTLVLNTENLQLKHNMVEEGGLFSSPKFDGWILTGDIRNNDGLDIYKNISIQLEYMDEAKHKLNGQQLTINKTIAPGTIIDLNEKVYPPDEMKTFSVSIANATLANPEQ